MRKIRDIPPLASSSPGSPPHALHHVPEHSWNKMFYPRKMKIRQCGKRRSTASQPNKLLQSAAHRVLLLLYVDDVSNSCLSYGTKSARFLQVHQHWSLWNFQTKGREVPVAVDLQESGKTSSCWSVSVLHVWAAEVVAGHRLVKGFYYVNVFMAVTH